MPPLAIEESIHVATPADKIWRLLADPTTWKTWWPGCVDAATADRKTLREGSRLELVLQPTWLRMTLRPKVEVATINRALIWVGQSAGIQGRHAWYLDEKPDGTRIREREDFTGAGVVLLHVLFQVGATRKMFQANLRGLKKMAERML